MCLQPDMAGPLACAQSVGNQVCVIECFSSASPCEKHMGGKLLQPGYQEMAWAYLNQHARWHRTLRPWKSKQLVLKTVTPNFL
jgi:hypothetical protein